MAILDHAVSACYGGVCGGSCGQRRSPVLAGDLHRQGLGVFSVSDYRDCTSEDIVKQVISALSTAQELGGNKQKRHLASKAQEDLRSLGRLQVFPRQDAICTL